MAANKAIPARTIKVSREGIFRIAALEGAGNLACCASSTRLRRRQTVATAPPSDCPSCAKSPRFSTTVSPSRHKKSAKSRAPKTRFHEAFHRDLGCPVPQRKNISLSVFPKSVIPYLVSRSQEGRTRRHERGVRDAMDASGVERRAILRADGEVVWS